MIEELTADHLDMAIDLIESLTESQVSLNAHIDRSWLKGEFKAARGVGEFEAPTREKLISLAFMRSGPDQSELTFIARRPGREHRGAARRILKFLQIESIPSIWLEVHEENVAARALYESVGFERVGRREKYYNGQKAALLYTYTSS